MLKKLFKPATGTALAILVFASASAAYAAASDHAISGTVYTGASVTAYIITWLVFYHLLFVLQESLPLIAGWREAVPWLVFAVPMCPTLGILAALSHRDGIIGDICITSPIIWLLPEALNGESPRGLSAIAIVIPVLLLFFLLLGLERAKRKVSMTIIVLALATLGTSSFFVYPIIKSIIH
ncbi:hypothetical protein [Paenibacillus sediminis]|nr:hypothetical protein [Paenibacillus sediminis]